MAATPYLFFEGRADEAIAFYEAALGAKVEMLSRFKEAPGLPPGGGDIGGKVMHSSLRIGEAVLFISDGMSQKPMNFEGFAVSLDFADAADVDRYGNALAQGGELMMPIGETFFAKRFAMVKDRFGVLWMLITEK